MSLFEEYIDIKECNNLIKKYIHEESSYYNVYIPYSYSIRNRCPCCSSNNKIFNKLKYLITLGLYYTYNIFEETYDDMDIDIIPEVVANIIKLCLQFPDMLYIDYTYQHYELYETFESIINDCNDKRVIDLSETTEKSDEEIKKEFITFITKLKVKLVI